MNKDLLTVEDVCKELALERTRLMALSKTKKSSRPKLESGILSIGPSYKNISPARF